MQDLLLVFLDKRDDFATKSEEFYNSITKKVLTTTNDTFHQLFTADVQVKNTYPELKSTFKKSNQMWHKKSL